MNALNTKEKHSSVAKGCIDCQNAPSSIPTAVQNFPPLFGLERPRWAHVLGSESLPIEKASMFLGSM